MTADADLPKRFEDLDLPSALVQALKSAPFNFRAMLPIQSVVLPYALRAFSGTGLHADVCLSAPTGAGKTLCYALPLLASVHAQKQRWQNDRHVRAIVVVPTRGLAQQVHAVLAALGQPLGIRVGGLYGGDGASGAPGATSTGAAATSATTTAIGTHEKLIEISGMRSLYRSVRYAGETEPRRYALVDILVATPQRLVNVLDQQTDAADTGKGADGSSSSDGEGHEAGATSTAAGVAHGRRVQEVFGRVQSLVLDEADEVLSSWSFMTLAGRIVDVLERSVTNVGETVLHKMLCSATLTSRISKVSEVRLQNARFFALSSAGAEIEASVQAQRAPGSLKAVGDAVRTVFPLPPTLREHLVVVRDPARRHVTLLQTVLHVLRVMRDEAAVPTSSATQGPLSILDTFPLPAPSGAADKKKSAPANPLGLTSSSHADAAPAAAGSADGSPQRRGGRSLLLFCATVDVARVMGHFLAAAGLPALELTTTATEAERRRAVISAVTSAGPNEQPPVIVATDALMRGIDLPGVGAVVMYDPPRSLPQYIHRVGRTARAGAVGDSYVLLSKEGPDGGFEGSDMAKFREFDALVQRNGKVDNDYRLRELHPDAVVKADGWLAAAKAALEVKGWVSAADAATAAAARTKQHQQPAHSGRPQQQQQHQQHRGSAHGAATPSRGAQQHSAQRRRPRD